MTTGYQHSPEGQLTDIGTLGARSTMLYDGRGFLRQAQKPAFSIFEDSFETVETSCWSDAVPSVTESRSTTGGPGCFTPGTPVTTTATYGSEGLLYSLLRSTGERQHVLHFAGRPVAQLRVPAAGAAAFTYLTTDHLGTPILAMNQAGTALWRGGFEPFGADWSGAGAAGVFLRFPGQWDDATWAGVGAAGLSYNLFRWYERGTGRYERADPLGLVGGINGLGYALQRPTYFADPTGTVVLSELCIFRAFFRSYQEMRQANWQFSDKYFHCKANCEAVKCDPKEYDEICMISDAREGFDLVIKGDPVLASIADEEANRRGRVEAIIRPNDSCQQICSPLRPHGLPTKY